VKKILGALLAMLVITFLLLGFMQPASSFHIFGYQAYTVLSNSMEPAFQTGDMIIIRKSDPSHIRAGDIITFRQSGRFVTHRVNAVKKEQENIAFQTKGDANNTIDEKLVPASSVIGKKEFHIPYAGYVARFMSSKAGIVIFIILPLILYSVLSIYQRLSPKNKTNSKITGRNYS